MDNTEFDPALAIADYRRIIGQRDKATTEIDRAEHVSAAQRMRAAWQEWQGEDLLHEMAFGEPYDE